MRISDPYILCTSVIIEERGDIEPVTISYPGCLFARTAATLPLSVLRVSATTFYHRFSLRVILTAHASSIEMNAITFKCSLLIPPPPLTATQLVFASCICQQEITRWSVLSDEACDAVMSSKQRLVKISEAVLPSSSSDPGERQPSDGTIGGDTTSNGKEAQQSLVHARKTSARGVLGRLSIGGSKKTLVDVFAVEPPRPLAPQRQSSSSSARSSRIASPRPTAGGGGGSRSMGSRRWGSPRDAQAHDDRRALFGEREGGEDGGRGATRGSSMAMAQAASGVAGAHAAISEAHDLAVERGEKLENLVDKSRQLEDSALAFGDMAKQLRRQQEAEACCVA